MQVDKIGEHHIRTIKGLIKRFHSEEDDFKIENFNHEVHKHLKNLFQKTFGKNFLYSTLLFVQDDIIQKHHFEFGNQFKEKTDSKKINYIENIQPGYSRKLRELNSTIGISNHIIDTKVNGVVFYKSKNENENTIRVNNKIPCSYNLNDVNIPNEIEKTIFNCKTVEELPDKLFCNEFYNSLVRSNDNLNKFKKSLGVKSDVSILKPILTLYKLAGNKLPEYFVYFIRPDTEHDYYNGLINIALSRPLRDNELAVINLLLFYVFSEVAIFRYKKDTRNAEWKNIIDDLSHSQNNIYSSLLKKTTKLKALFSEIEKNVQESSAYISIYKETERKLINQIKILEKSTKLNLAIGKYTIDKNNLGSTLLEVIKPSLVNIGEILKLTYEILLDGIEDIDFTKEIHKEQSAKYIIQNHTKQYNKLSNYNLSVSETAFFITVLELLKNAIKYSDNEKPIFKVSIIENIYENYHALSFFNNSPMPKLNRRFFETRGTYTTTAQVPKNSFGIRTVFRLMNSKIFETKETDFEWFIDVSPIEKSKNDETEILLMIPKTYLSHG